MSSSSRTQSQGSRYGRQRSNTTQSAYKPNNTSAASVSSATAPSVKVGESKTLAAWVHDHEKLAAVIFNHNWWPGINEGDLLRATLGDPDSGFLFFVPREDLNPVKPQLQISIPGNIAEVFGIRNNGEITVTKLDKDSCKADYVEFAFQDQYLGRNEMWRLGQYLVGKCVYVDQDISFIGVIAAKVTAIYVGGHRVTAGCMTSATKAIYRSLSAKTTLFIQICKEFWQFADDGERYYEKVVHSFLPALCTKWREAGTNHIVTIVLVSRVFYDQSEIDYAAGPLRRDDEGRWYKDFYRVINDLEVVHDWKSTLASLKDSFWAFQRDILLTHHYHQASLGHSSALPQAPPLPRLVGQLSHAHDGPILEALNLSLNPTETHYIDRSLSLTGASMIIITPGTGYFRVPKHLLRLTTTRLVDLGFAVDLVTLTKPPLHQSPIFCFWGVEPELKVGGGATGSTRSMDPLWGGDDDPHESLGKERTMFWWEPFWMSVSFWNRQMDLPFREDRFVARARMYEIRALGLLDHDVLSSIEIPYLPKFYSETMTTPVKEHFKDSISKEDADKFDQDVFALSRNVRPLAVTRNSYASSGSGTILSSSYRSVGGRHIQRPGSLAIPPIEESPRLPHAELIAESIERLSALSAVPLSSSPSRSSVHSKMSTQSGSSGSTNASGKSRKTGSRFAPTWFFNPFRGGLSQPQTSNVSASAVTSPTLTTPPRITPSPSALTLTGSGLKTPVPRSPKPVNILPRASPRSSILSRTLEEDSTLPNHRGSLTRTSPLNTPPRAEATITIMRRTGSTQLNSSVPFPSSLPTRTNPSFPREYVPYPQSSLARRWQHTYPEPLSRMEIKWKSMVTPACLPLTVEHFPTKSELESSYDIFSYEFVVDPPEMRSFLVKPPVIPKGASRDEARRAWAAAIMREMVALRLAQGFQFILKSSTPNPSKLGPPPARFPRRPSTFITDEELNPQAVGAADVLSNSNDPVYLSMSNEIHQISYTGEVVRVRRYVRRMAVSTPIEYQCLIWPKLGEGYTELKTSFVSHGLENYGWNRLDMLIAGYENQLHESLRYWRTRFIVVPSTDSPTNTGPTGEKLDDEEIRLVGMDKLADLFSRVRWQAPDGSLGTGTQTQPIIRFLTTDLGPASCVLDEVLMNRLDEIHALGPLRKNMKSEREISQMNLSAIAKAMREDPVSLPIKDYRWHRRAYTDAFTGSDFVNWLVKEFRDVLSRDQAIEVGARLQSQGLFDHAKRTHGFLDGHYFYQLRPEFFAPSTPRGWFRTKHPSTFGVGEGSGFYSSNNRISSRRTRKRLILSQSLVIDIDGNKRSDQAETVILHHDIIHNPATCFHFELQWIGTTARCIEDQLKQWNRTIERYGLKLVEAYVGQICDIREQNPFQSCYPVRLSVPPPAVLDLEKRVPEGTQTNNYFENALLRKFGFVLDIEAASTYSEQIDPVYSYRRAPFKYSQWVHRSGVVFAQTLGGSNGFLFLTNRLMAPGRMGTSLKSKEQSPSALADDVMLKINGFCSDPTNLYSFYEEEMAALTPVAEDPPPLKL